MSAVALSQSFHLLATAAALNWFRYGKHNTLPSYVDGIIFPGFPSSKLSTPGGETPSRCWLMPLQIESLSFHNLKPFADKSINSSMSALTRMVSAL